MRIRMVAGLTILVTGSVLLSISGIYYFYSFTATSNLSELTHESSIPEFFPTETKHRIDLNDSNRSMDQIVQKERLPTKTKPESQTVELSTVPQKQQVATEESPVETQNTGKNLKPNDTPPISGNGNSVKLKQERPKATASETVIQADTPEIEDREITRSHNKLPTNTNQSNDSKVGSDIENQITPLTKNATVASTKLTANPVDKSLNIVSEKTGEPVIKIVDSNPIKVEPSPSQNVSTDKIASSELNQSAVHISIPAIKIGSTVVDLNINHNGNSYSWETPKWVVGHIPTTPKPGNNGQGWYFGHLESLIMGEGNVFKGLPRIPPLLKRGEDIYVVLKSLDRKYLYKVYRTEIVHEDDIKITNSDRDEITLVTCVPRFVYNHRLLVTASLVGTNDLDQED